MSYKDYIHKLIGYEDFMGSQAIGDAERKAFSDWYDELFSWDNAKSLQRGDWVRDTEGHIYQVLLAQEPATLRPYGTGDSVTLPTKDLEYIPALESYLITMEDAPYGKIRVAPPAVKYAVATPVQTTDGREGLITRTSTAQEMCSVATEDGEADYSWEDILPYGPAVIASVADDPERSIVQMENGRLARILAVSPWGKLRLQYVDGLGLPFIASLIDIKLAIPDSDVWSFAHANSFYPGQYIKYQHRGATFALVTHVAEDGTLSLHTAEGPAVIPGEIAEAYRAEGMLSVDTPKHGCWIAPTADGGYTSSNRHTAGAVRSAALFLSTVVKKTDGWYVESRDGKNLGGPYDTKEEADERLRQVEYFKHQSAVYSYTGVPVGTFFLGWSGNVTPVFLRVSEPLPESLHQSGLKNPVYLQSAPSYVQEFTAVLEQLRQDHRLVYEHTVVPTMKCVEAVDLAPILQVGESYFTIYEYPEVKTATNRNAAFRKLDRDVTELSAKHSWVELDVRGRKTLIRNPQL